MKKINVNIVTLLNLLLIIVAIPLSAQDINNSIVSYMRLGVGARIIAMGEAGSSVTNDIASGYWNPAGLVKLKDVELGTMLNAGMDNDRSHMYASLGNRFSFGAVALNWVNAGVTDIDGYDDNGEPTGTFSDQENCFALSYANSIGRLSFGFSPKYYLSSIAGNTQSGVGIDAGAKIDLNQYLEVGVMARDIYGKFNDETIPYELAAGLSLYPVSGITLAADAKMEKDEDPYFCFGAEYWTSIGKDQEADSKLSVITVQERNSWDEMLSNLQTGIRLGYNQGRISAGTGIRVGTFQLDYVFRLNNHEVFGNDHIISLILRF